MIKIEDIIADERYKIRIQQLDSKTLKIVIKDHIKTLTYASKGIEQLEPDKVNDLEYLQVVADGMQQLAKIVLEKRSKKT